MVEDVLSGEKDACRQAHVTRSGDRPLARRILHGEQERIFQVLPQTIISNFTHTHSENALLWNQVYPLASPTLSWMDLAAIKPAWGSAVQDQGQEDDPLLPYFWGFDVEGERLPGLDPVLEEMDGPGNKTEIDLILVGGRHLVSVEVKHLSNPGRCARYQAGRCPEIHIDETQPGVSCRYWEPGPGKMSSMLELGERPTPGSVSPPCNQHYQLARTLLVGSALARVMNLEMHMWLVTTRRGWRSLERTWLDFVGRIRDDTLWRRMRVLTWEDLGRLT